MTPIWYYSVIFRTKGKAESTLIYFEMPLVPNLKQHRFRLGISCLMLLADHPPISQRSTINSNQLGYEMVVGDQLSYENRKILCRDCC